MIDRLWVVVHHELQVYKLGMAPNCEAEISNMINHAVNEIRSRHVQLMQASQPLPPALTQSIEDDLRKFVRTMAEDAIQKGYIELHEDTFFAAKGRLCPGLWPFC